MTYTNKERMTRYRARHRDEINARQLAKYHALTPKQKRERNGTKGEPVTGTLAAIEAPDTCESVAPNLREKYLLALMTRDAKVWRAHYRFADQAMGQDDALSSGEASQIKTRVPTSTFEGQPCRKCGGTERYSRSRVCVTCAKANDAKRRAAWTPERCEAQRQRRVASLVYQGRPCPQCGSTERFISTSNCVACTPPPQKKIKEKQKSAGALARAAAAAARAAAVTAGANTYSRGRPCAKCGRDSFYVASCSCVTCKNARRPIKSAVKPSLPRLSQYASPLRASNAYKPQNHKWATH